MPAITTWSSLSETEGRVLEVEWESFFEQLIAYGKQPFRGEMMQPGWSPARIDPPKRLNANVQRLSALVLDYDGGVPLEEAKEMWGIFGGLIHTTRRHESREHRFRVILPLSREVTCAEYAVLWKFFVRTSGHHVDKGTKDLSRFWYVPGSSNGGGFQYLHLRGGQLDPDVFLAAAEEEEKAERDAKPVTRIHPSAKTREDQYALAALHDACDKVRVAVEGSRNNTLFIAASTAGNFIASGNLLEEYAVSELEDAARVCGLAPFEARKTILSGITRGMKSPRQAPEPEPRPSSASSGQQAASSGAPSSEPPPGAPSSPESPLHPLSQLWKSVGEWGLLDGPPPPQQWVLMRPDVETNGMGAPLGLLPRSEVGFLIAAGGVGKTIALIQLALSVATGRKWLDYFLVPSPGRVLVLLGEEKLAQAHRRFYELSGSMRLTDAQVAEVKERVVMLPLGGVIAPLVQQDGTDTFETSVMAFLRAQMAEVEWTLVIMDPLSRFAGPDTEKDNVQATRFVQVAETLCSAPGAPSVLFAHHTNKVSRNGDTQASAADARGSTGTTDGGRWCANLMHKKGGATLHFTKNNYAEGFDETVVLERSFGGYLRVQTDEARRRAEEAQEAAEGRRSREVLDKVREALRREPGLNKNELRQRTRMRDREVRQAVDQLEADGEIYQRPRYRYHLRSQSDV